MNWPAIYASILAHYTAMARIPGAKAYAWGRVNEMAKADPDLWGMLPAQVMEAAR